MSTKNEKERKAAFNEALEYVPKSCPFCKGVDGVAWTELKLKFVEEHFIDEEVGAVFDKYDMQLFCTRCEEQILPDDLCNCDAGRQMGDGHTSDCPAHTGFAL